MSAFDIVPGDPSSAVIIHVPHSSREIPIPVRAQILLDDDALEVELDAMTDRFTDVVADTAADRSRKRPWIFVNRLSRLVVDPERFPDDREEMNEVGMGAVYTRTSDGRRLRHDRELRGLIETYFEPYAAAFADLVDDRLRRAGSVTILDVHSYPVDALPYELHGDGPRPPVCLGTDAFHTPPSVVDAARRVVGRYYDVGLDSPFAGTYVPTRHHQVDPRVRSLMIEIRRDQITVSPQQVDADGARRMATTVAHLIDELEGAGT